MDLELIQIEPQTALAVFTTENALEPYLQRVRDEVFTFKADVSTSKGRGEIRSFAAKVTKVKTYIEGIGKGLADEQKLIPKKIDAARKHAKDTLEALAEQARKPLTDWEDAEEARVDAHKNTIARMEQIAGISPLQRPVHELREFLAEIEAIGVGPQCEEYEAAYAKAKDAAVQALTAGIEARGRYEAEQAELAELRRQADERAKKDREEQIAREAAEKAKREAEEKAAADARCAEEAILREREAAERREQDLKRAAEDAERRAADAEEAARRRQAQEKAAEEAEAKRREADKQHRGRVNREALQALVSGGIAEEAAKAVLKLIIAGQVPHVSIRY
ncbi:hypothetical protein EZH22_24610 [Xanthobacter dioxanivorans]|uniref:Uncharacterized protein n=1 Tax=Xanthobacter dioxanivorans TaxID=2528964 RepID=A0A974PM81_9HYPH|nr:hypothetical protein [Xanthobacter dioxanivorans]QRG06134.1 hypothetical protein EZH22_24610 [Xanthobacter dioxanivorans]